MAAKSTKQPKNLLDWVVTQGNAAVTQVLEDVLGRPGVAEGLSNVVQRAAKTKGQMDKNAQTILHLLNLPSSADYQTLKTKIETLQGSLVNLNMKLDRVLAQQQQHDHKKSRKVED